MSFSPLSPGIYTTEVDTTTSIPAVSVSTGGFAGTFNWGPALLPVSISVETQLNKIFGSPDNNTAISYFCSSSFLAYSNALQVTRAAGTNSNNATSNGVGA